MSLAIAHLYNIYNMWKIKHIDRLVVAEAWKTATLITFNASSDDKTFDVTAFPF